MRKNPFSLSSSTFSAPFESVARSGTSFIGAPSVRDCCSVDPTCATPNTRSGVSPAVSASKSAFVSMNARSVCPVETAFQSSSAM